MKKLDIKKLHIVVIILGIIFILLSAFHSNIWFDESYSVAIAKHSFTEIWKITGNDVHPALYYWMLHCVYLLFGNSPMIFRIFSVVAIVLLRNFRIYSYKKRFWRKGRNYIFLFNIFFTSNVYIFTGNTNVFMVLFVSCTYDYICI